MARHNPKKVVELVVNETESSHLANVKSLLGASDRFICMTAFARESGFQAIQKLLKERLAEGLEALFVVGLDFFHTDPSVLQSLFDLKKKHALKLFVSKPSWESDGTTTRNFHPKVFIFENAETHVMIGSANFTGGGLIDNHEFSVVVCDESGEISDGIGLQIDQLIGDKQIVAASPALLAEYAKRHAICKAHERLTKWRVKQALENHDTQDLHLLRGYLAKMKADKTGTGFDASIKQRRACRKQSQEKLWAILQGGSLTRKQFLAFYEPLVTGLWHSGGLQRGKNRVADHVQGFQEALSTLTSIGKSRIGEAFDTLLQHLLGVKGAGINVLTEILHSFDNQRFVVMNQNSISGLGLGGYDGFPRHPSKLDVDAAAYVDFCEKAADVRDRLGLKDFTELDALFNYAYWIDSEE